MRAVQHSVQQNVARLARLFMLASLLGGPAYGDAPSFNPFPFNMPSSTGGIPGLPRDFRTPLTENKEPGLEDFFKHVDVPVLNLQPGSLAGVKIPGLTQKTVGQLGMNYFVVLDNTPFLTMADVYKDSRIKGKPNFVSADSIIQPYLAFTNGLCANLIETQITPELNHFLYTLLADTERQYQSAKDASIRDDIERNHAFLTVAARLLNPAVSLDALGSAGAMVDSEIANVNAGLARKSPIFGRTQDYAVFVPIGWYRNNPKLSNYYRCRQWLSQMYFPLSESSTSGEEGSSNNFRRSVLIHQVLSQATVNGVPALKQWAKLARMMQLIGSASATQDTDLLPDRYATVFQSTQPINVNSLSEPLYRTKLLLSVRRQKPMEISSKSVFEMNQVKASAEESYNVVFRLFPVTEDPELAFLRKCGHNATPEDEAGFDLSLALLELFAHGSPEATNVLTEQMWHMDPKFAKSIPELLKAVKKPDPKVPYSVGDGRWQLIGCFFKPLPDGSQQFLRTEPWLVHRLEGAIGAWLDGHLSLGAITEGEADAGTALGAGSAGAGPAQVAAATAGAGAGPAKAAGAGAVSRSARDTATVAGEATSATTIEPNEVSGKMANFQYLEPAADLFRRLDQDSTTLQKEMDALGALPDSARKRFDDFTRLFLRLAGIADRELNQMPVSPNDMKLLGNIDLVLNKVAVPVAGTLYLNTGYANAKSTKSGCNLGLGHPGQLFTVCQTTKGPMLCRGAVYSYFEVPDKPVAADVWNRKVESGKVKPPGWVAGLDVVQEPDAGAIKASQ